MKILIDLSSLDDNFSGIERYAKNMAQKMILLDKSNLYILLFKNKVHESFDGYNKKYHNVEFIILPGGNKFIYYQHTLYRCLIKTNADRYLFFAFQSPWLFKHKGIYNTIHDTACFDCPHTMKLLQRIYFKYSYKRAAEVSEGILTVSKFSKRRILSLFDLQTEKVNVINSGLEEEFFVNCNSNSSFAKVKEKYNLPNDYILCLSTIEPRKNMKLLLQAYTSLKNELPDIPKLVLVGRKGWMVDELLKNTDDDIIATGFVDNEDIPIIYKQSKLFVFPSLYEGFGLPPVEALAMGAKVLSSDAASLPEVLGDNAEYFKSDDIENLKKALKSALTNYSNNNQTIERGRAWALQYTFDKAAQKAIEIISKQDM